jgi:SAM-dependent methyltransferase
LDVGTAAEHSTALDPDAADLPRLKAILDGHGFAGEAVRQALGTEIGPAHLRKDLPLYLRRLAVPKPLHTLIKCFTLGQWVDADDAQAALAPMAVADLLAAGILERGRSQIRASVALAVHRDLLLFHDRFDPESSGLHADHVLGTNAPAITLDSLTVRRPVRSTLDLGSGGGVQSLLAARHSAEVVAVDTNPRALLFTRLNARLNGVVGIECREGDLFAPVAGHRFDLVVCNPPYVISPDSRFIFQDSGRPADAMCEEVVRRAGGHLVEGGFATVLCNWGLRRGEDWSDPLRRWVDGSGCDAWLLRSDVQDPLTYAAVWNRTRDEKEYDAAIDRWMAYYRETGIEAIAMGAVILRRRARTANWVRADPLPRDPQDPCHEHILRVFAGQDELTRMEDDRALLARAFSLAEDHRLTQTLKLHSGQYVIDAAEIQLPGGLGFRGTVDPYTLRLLQLCDGRRLLADVVDELARLGSTDRDRLAAVITVAVRKLVALGFLIPSGDGTGLGSPHGDV